MARKKNEGLKPWATAKTPQETKETKQEPFIQLGATLLQSKTFQSLSHTTRNVYFAMLVESKGFKEFEFSRTTSARYGFSDKTTRRAINRLIEQKFIVKKQSGKNTRTPNKYEFSQEWKFP